MNAHSVLIIDDDMSDRKLLRRMLTRIGNGESVRETTTATEALAMSDIEPDAVFLDHLLPDATGLSCIPEIRQKWGRAAIFFMTGQGDEELAKTAIQSGADDYIPKQAITEAALQRMMKTGVESVQLKWKVDQQRLDLATFSEVLVHDFKAPIRATAYLAEQIEEDLATGDFEEVQKGLALMRKSTTRMMSMLKSLSDHIRLDRNAEIEELTAGQLIDTALTGLELEISETGTRVDIVVDPLLPDIPCNGPMISLVLQNLVANAIKYAGEHTPKIRIGASCHGLLACFEIADNGIGIAAEYAEGIFEPFKRVPGMGDVQGTGLGLATCRKIVLRHGGRIWCESELGHGTRIFFTLPLSQANALH